MATFFYQSKGTTQAYLGSVMVCPECRGQKDKGGFRVLLGKAVCADCYEELTEEILDERN